MPEFRKNIRIAVYNGPDFKKVMKNYTVNLSTGGVFIETANIKAVDTKLVVKFNLPDSDRIISCNARVAWTNEPGQIKKFSLPPGMGIQFIDLSLDDLRAIRDFLMDCELDPVW